LGIGKVAERFIRGDVSRVGCRGLRKLLVL